LTAGLEALLSRLWWQPQRRLGAWLLWPLSLLYRALRAVHQSLQPQAEVLPVPVLVVGNWVVGGAGKTPTVMSVVQALQAAGHQPGVISRGHGRQSSAVQAVLINDTPADVGDEPLLIHRRCQVPVWVGRQRVQAATALCQAHPAVDVLVADDGLQHHALARQAELVVFDERGAGNGLLLPAGPLRERLPEALPRRCRVLYTAGMRSTALPGALAERTIQKAWPLSTWAGDPTAEGEAQPLSSLQGRPLLAAAGIAAPEKFFGMLQAAGLHFERLPLPDHHPYSTLPWPAGAQEIVTTEKDAVKLIGRDLGGRRVWVVPLDLQLPATLVGELLDLLFPHAGHEPEAKP